MTTLYSLRTKKANNHLNSSQEVRLDLLEFWHHFNGRNNWGYGFSQHEKLSYLLRYSYKKYTFKTRDPKVMRVKFQRPLKKFLNLFKHNCFVCYGPGQHRHHIILLKNGGPNSRKNLLTLCINCHSIIHPWLRRPENVVTAP